MDSVTPTPRDISTVERAVRHAFEHASAQGEHETAAELAAILHLLTLRAAGATQGKGWDTVPASGRTH